MRAAVLVGGSGLTGRATARRLLAEGWAVRLVGRNPAHVPVDLREVTTFATADRSDAAALAAAVGSGADLLVDCVCFTASHARTLLPLLGDVGSAVVVSSKAVYVDDAGRHSNSEQPPAFAGPVTEAQPTLAPDWSDEYQSRRYGACKVAMEQTLLDSGRPVTVLRPSKVHGEGATAPHEWPLVKRVLDSRRLLPLAHGGRSGDHPTAAVNIAALVAAVAERPGARVLNAADPDTPTVRDIARVVADVFGHEWDEVPLPDDADPALGASPWNRWPPVWLDLSAAAELGYRPAGDYAATVAPALRWLAGVAHPGPDGYVLPDGFDVDGFERYAGVVQYAREDAALASGPSSGLH